MELPALAIFLVLWSTAAIGHPRNSYVLPKEYYQRQNLPEIPGYIPVYIKHDDEPLPKWKENLSTKAGDQTENKKDEHSLSKERQTPETESAGVKEQPQPEHKGKTKKVTENFQSLKIKENKE